MERSFQQRIIQQKQRLYSQKFNSSSIYTPQVVINGNEHFVGSNAQKMNTKIKHYASIPAENKIEVSLVSNTDEIVTFNYSVLGDVNNKVLRAVLVVGERITKIPKGENRNRTLKNSNIVIFRITVCASIFSRNTNIIVPEIVNKEDNLRLVIIIQNTDLKIVGAHQLNL